MLEFQCGSLGSDVLGPCATVRSLIFQYGPEIVALVVEFQCGSSDFSVGPKIPVWIPVFYSGFWDSNINSGILV